MEAQGPPPGWYQNPEGPGQRYWDGAQWADSYPQGPPPGWYQNPEGPGQRYWDGTQWADSYSQGPQPPLQLTLEPDVVVAGDDAVAVVSLPEDAGLCTVTLAYSMTLRPPGPDTAGNVSMGSRQTRTVEVAVGESDAAGGVLRMDLPVPIEGPPTAYDRDDSTEWFVQAWAGDQQAVARLAVLSPPELHADWADGIHREGEPRLSLTRKRLFLAEELPSERRPPHPPGCFMQIELPSGSVALGETLTGTLLLRPDEPVRARSVRVELEYLRVEVQDLYAAPDFGPTVSSVVVARDQALAGNGEEAVFPFEITVPAHGPPSYLAQHSHLHWNLVAIVDRRRNFDFATHIELNVHSEPVVGEAREERLRELVATRGRRAEEEARARQPTPPDGPPPSMKDLKRRFGRNRSDWWIFRVRDVLSALLEEGESVYDIAVATKGVLDGVEVRSILVVASDRRVLVVSTTQITFDSFTSVPYSELSQATVRGPTLALRIPSGTVQLEMDNAPAQRIVEFMALRAGLPPDSLLSA